MKQSILTTIITSEAQNQLQALVKEYLDLGWTLSKKISKYSIELSFQKNSQVKIECHSNGLMKTFAHLNKEGLKQGYTIKWYISGQKKEKKRFHCGVQHGKFSLWNSDGIIVQKGEYNNGHEHGLWIDNYNNGKIRYKQNWILGKKDGLSKRWHPNGILREHGKYQKGQKFGKWFSWHNSNQKKEELYFEYGVLNGPIKRWDHNGNVCLDGFYRNGKR